MHDGSDLRRRRNGGADNRGSGQRRQVAAGTAETVTCTTGGTFRVEAIQDIYDLGLDFNNAHVQPTGEYHYHRASELLNVRLRRIPGYEASPSLAGDVLPIPTTHRSNARSKTDQRPDVDDAP